MATPLLATIVVAVSATTLSACTSTKHAAAGSPTHASSASTSTSPTASAAPGGTAGGGNGTATGTPQPSSGGGGVAPGTDCGTSSILGPDVPPLHIIVASGSISCASAIQSLTTVLHQIPNSGSGAGSGGGGMPSIKVAGWSCTGPLSTADAQKGIIIKCSQGATQIRAQEFAG